MDDFIENALKNEMLKTTDGTIFFATFCQNRRAIDCLANSIKELIAQYGLSASETKGFLDYMKIVIDASSYLSPKK
jgi:hypothetical protein